MGVAPSTRRLAGEDPHFHPRIKILSLSALKCYDPSLEVKLRGWGNAAISLGDKQPRGHRTFKNWVLPAGFF